MKIKKIKRRNFLKKSGISLLGVAASVGFSTIPHKVLGANEKLVVGVIGTGGMGRSNMRVFLENKDIGIAAVCDVYKPSLKKALDMTEGRASAYGDFRRIIERKDIDVVIIATPDHWHALPTILACDAGKDVYVEKPVSHNIYEGRKMVEAAGRNKRIVQVGTQQRSGRHYQKAVELIQSGKLGNITMVKCWNFTNEYPGGIGNPPDSAPPADLDWNMWLGPAPEVPFNRNKCFNFRWFFDYAGGMITDWGTHHIDIIQWAMNVDAPLAVSASGGKYYIRDNRETPDTIEANYEYPGFIMTFTNTILNTHGFDSRAPNGADRYGYGIQFYGTNGTLFIDRMGYRVEPEVKKKDGEIIEMMGKIESSAAEYRKPHVGNFIDCIKSRKLPVCDIETGHRSTTTPLLGNIAYKTKQRIEWDAKNERITNSVEANKLLKREYRAPWKL